MLIFAVVLAVGVITVQGADNCTKSVTTVNGNEVCANELIFSDTFTDIDKEKWKNSIQIAANEDDEFAVYNDNAANHHICENKLCILPTLMSEQKVTSGEINLARCTDKFESFNCKKVARGYSILPPIESAEIRTKHFNFRYGIVEIKAKLPEGDWIVPQLWLESKDREYGPYLNSGRIIIAGSVGNQRLVKVNGADISSRQLQSGVAVGVGPKIYKASVKLYNKTASWSNDYHIFKVVWKPDSIDFVIDGNEVKKPPLSSITAGNPLVKRLPFTDDERNSIWGQQSQIAPFDKEFQIVLGVTVGGSRTFPDNCVTSNNHKKPWSSTDAKFVLNFWKDRDNWHSTWKGINSALIVEYVKVWSL